jgi:hypothetical protein
VNLVIGATDLWPKPVKPRYKKIRLHSATISQCTIDHSPRDEHAVSRKVRAGSKRNWDNGKLSQLIQNPSLANASGGADQWLKREHSSLSTNQLAKRYGCIAVMRADVEPRFPLMYVLGEPCKKWPFRAA